MAGLSEGDRGLGVVIAGVFALYGLIWLFGWLYLDGPEEKRALELDEKANELRVGELSSMSGVTKIQFMLPEGRCCCLDIPTEKLHCTGCQPVDERAVA